MALVIINPSNISHELETSVSQINPRHLTYVLLPSSLETFYNFLVNLHVLKYSPHKLIRSPVPQSPTENTHAHADQHHVAKVKRCLHQPMHTRLEHEVVNRI